MRRCNKRVHATWFWWQGLPWRDAVTATQGRGPGRCVGLELINGEAGAVTEHWFSHAPEMLAWLAEIPVLPLVGEDARDATPLQRDQYRELWRRTFRERVNGQVRVDRAFNRLMDRYRDLGGPCSRSSRRLFFASEWLAEAYRNLGVGQRGSKQTLRWMARGVPATAFTFEVMDRGRV